MLDDSEVISRLLSSVPNDYGFLILPIEQFEDLKTIKLEGFWALEGA